jgi:hypothetical protein
MPRWASRLTLEVIKVWVERVQDITAENAFKEGIGFDFNEQWCCYTPDVARAEFAELWNKLYAKRGYGWDINSWVWVVEFRRVER